MGGETRVVHVLEKVGHIGEKSSLKNHGHGQVKLLSERVKPLKAKGRGKTSGAQKME